jgi:VWFA-related protein
MRAPPRFWPLAAALWLSIISLGAVQDSGPVLRIVQPEPGVVASGTVVLEAGVTPADVAVRAVTFYVDGQQVCRVTARPFECQWEAGSVAAPRSVRVSAELADGRRLVQTLRTAPPPARAEFRSAVEMVLVPVFVTDGRGQFIRDLSASDFRVSEEGVAQPAQLVRTGDHPASVLLALDVSSSMESAVGELRRAAARFLEALGPEDAIVITAFNEELHVLLRSGATPSARLEALERLRPSGGTALYDGIIRAVDIISTLPSPRAIVVFSDGEDTRSRSLPSSVRVTLQRNNIVLYLIAQTSERTPGSLRTYLAPLAAETGGIAWFPTRMTAVVDHFGDVVQNLRNQYVLAYQSPPAGGGWRRISVTMAADRGFRVRSREGYMAADGGGHRP